MSNLPQPKLTDSVAHGWAIVRSDHSRNIHVPKTGVIVELTIKAIPPLSRGPITKYFQVKELPACRIEVKEVVKD